MNAYTDTAAHNGNGNQREKFAPRTNAPEVVAFRFAEGREIDGQFGKSVMLSLTDGRVWFAPPIIQQKLDAISYRAGDPVEVCKSEVQDGKKKRIEWRVEHVNPAGDSGKVDPPGQTQQLRSNSAQPQPTAIEPVKQAPEPPANGLRTVMTQCLIDACAAACEAERWAKDHDYSLRFTSEDVRTIANTLYIQRSKEGAWQRS